MTDELTPTAVDDSTKVRSEPDISIVVRTMGRPELARALDSLRSQTLAPSEIVLVVANPAWVPSAELRQSCRLITPGHALSRPAAANAGIAAARGAWLGFLDEDDWLEPDHLATISAACAQALRGGSRVVYGDLVTHDGATQTVHARGFWRRKQADAPIPHLSNILVERSLIERNVCWFDENFDVLEDWDFFVQLSEHTDFSHVPCMSAHYESHLGTSGCGHGQNRDMQRMRPYLDKLNAKWGRRQAELIATADRSLDDARAAYRRGDFRSAESLALTGLMADAGHPALLNVLAACRDHAGDRASALGATRRACDSDRSDFTPHFDLAAYEHRYGSRASAATALSRARELARLPEHQERLRVLDAAISAATSKRTTAAAVTPAQVSAASLPGPSTAPQLRCRKLVGVCMAKNEADIIETFVRHNLQFLDRIFILDHDSSDQTASILQSLRNEGLPITLSHDATASFMHAKCVTSLAAEAFRALDVDFVFPLDADEFIRASSRAALEASLADTRAPVLDLTWQTYVVDIARADESHPFLRLPLRVETGAAGLRKVVLSKRICEIQNWKLSPGNHAVGCTTDGNWRRVESEPLRNTDLAHFPMRSIEQVISKALIGSLSSTLAFGDAAEAQHVGTHWGSLHRKIVRGEGPDLRSMQRHAVAAYAMNRSLDEPCTEGDDFRLLRDPLPVTFDLLFTPARRTDPLLLVATWASRLVEQVVRFTNNVGAARQA